MTRLLVFTVIAAQAGAAFVAYALCLVAHRTDEQMREFWRKR